MIYVITHALTGHAKIGISDRPFDRMRKMQTDCPGALLLRALIDAPNSLERELHARFAKYRANGEWFRLEGDLAEWVLSLPIVNKPESERGGKAVRAVGMSKAAGVAIPTAYGWMTRNRYPVWHWRALIDGGFFTIEELAEMHAKRLA